VGCCPVLPREGANNSKQQTVGGEDKLYGSDHADSRSVQKPGDICTIGSTDTRSGALAIGSEFM
jgi:hypothetical protein